MALAQDHWRKVEKARQRLVLCRLMIDIMRTVHEAYVPASEPFGVHLETCFIGLCVAIGDLDGRPFSVAKIAAYMGVPRTTVIRRLAQLKSWGLIDREGRRYYLREKTLNSPLGMRSYQQVRSILNRATAELAILDISTE
jgi:biotin operon repressor